MQARDGTGNPVAHFVKLALAPDRFFGTRAVHDGLCASATESFAGLKVVQRRPRRTGHRGLLAFCRAELGQENYFHAVLEAAKSVAQKIRDGTGLDGDAAALVDAAFPTKSNMHRWRSTGSTTPTSFSSTAASRRCSRAFFMTFRNPTAHAPKVRLAMDEADPLDMLAPASTFPRRLDQATVTPAAPAYHAAA